MLKNGDICPICDQGKVESKLVEELFEYKGEQHLIKDLKICRCTHCEEEFVDSKSIKSKEKEVRDFHRKVDGLFTSEEIRRIRKSLGFTQKGLSEFLGCGEKNFARYENGTVTQSIAFNHLLKIIWEQPSALDIIKPTNNDAVSKTVYKIKGNIYKYA